MMIYLLISFAALRFCGKLLSPAKAQSRKENSKV